MKPKAYRRRPSPLSPGQPRGGVLVCVLVVLLIVGLLTSQTLQTLLMVRHSDAQRQQLRQARELVDLGRAWLEAQDAPASEHEFEIVVDQATQKKGTVKIIQLETTDDQASSWRVVASYPVGTAAEVTATWETGR